MSIEIEAFKNIFFAFIYIKTIAVIGSLEMFSNDSFDTSKFFRKFTVQYLILVYVRKRFISQV